MKEQGSFNLVQNLGHKGSVLRPRCIGPGRVRIQIPLILIYDSVSEVTENGWSCMCELLALPACPLHPQANRDQVNSEKNAKDISTTFSIFSSICATNTSALTSNATNHSSIHHITITTTNNTLYKKKNG